MLRENFVETEDSFLSLGFNGLKNYSFFDIDEINTYEKPAKNDILFSEEIFLDRNIIFHTRSVYGILDLFGDVGGVLGILQTIVAYLVAPYNETSFILKVAKKDEVFCTKLALVMMNFATCAKVMSKKIVKLKLLFDETSERLMESLDILTIMDIQIKEEQNPSFKKIGILDES